MKKLLFAIVSAALVTAQPVWAEDDEPGEDMRPYVSIDQDKIVNKTDNKEAHFEGLIDRIKTELLETGLYRVMSMEDALKIQQDQMKWAVIADDNGGETKVKTPGFFVSMSILTYGVSSAVGQNPLTGVVTGQETAKIELILNVVDARTGEMIKSKNISGSAAGSASVSANLTEQVLQTASKKAVEKIVYELIKLTPFAILDVEDGVVNVDVPGSLKIMGRPIQPGSQFVVSKLGKGKKSRRSGKVTYSEKQVAVLAITSVGEDSCSAVILQGAEHLVPIGDDEDTQYEPYIVKINEGSVAPPPVAPVAHEDSAPF